MSSTAPENTTRPNANAAVQLIPEDPSPARSLRILHVIDSGGLYGAEKVLLALGTECRRLGHDVWLGTIVAPQDREDALGNAAKAAGLNHVAFRMRDGLNLSGVAQILRYAREHRMDVIHSHGYKANILLGMTPQRFRPCAMICTLHGWTSASRISRLTLYEWLERRLVGGFEKVAVVSHAIAERLPELRDRVVLVQNGVPADLSPRLRDTLASQSTPVGLPRILAAGRLSFEKGFDVLIGAVEHLRSKDVPVVVTIAGDGPRRSELEAQASRANLTGNIRFTGYVGDLERLYDEADLFVLCSRTEGLPLVLLEAMSRGIPVIGTAVGQVPDVLANGEYGRLVEAGDPVVLAEVIEAQLREPSARVATITGRAAERVRNCYSAESMAAAYCSIYLECANGH